METKKEIEIAQEKLEWAIKKMELKINCKVIEYQDEKYHVQFFSEAGKLIIATRKIEKERIEDTNPAGNIIDDRLKSLLRKLAKKT